MNSRFGKRSAYIHFHSGDDCVHCTESASADATGIVSEFSSKGSSGMREQLSLASLTLKEICSLWFAC